MTQCRGNRVGETKADGSWRGVSRKAEKVERLIFHALFPFLVACMVFLGQLHTRLDIASIEFPKFFLIVYRPLFLFLLISLSLLEKHHDHRDSDGKVVGPRSTRRFRATKSSRAGQLEMPWKQNRYLILTKPRPHKRIFSGSRFRNESSRVDSVLFRLPFSPFSSPLSFSLSTDLLFVFVSGVCVAKPPLLLERKYRG